MSVTHQERNAWFSHSVEEMVIWTNEYKQGKNTVHTILTKCFSNDINGMVWLLPN